MAPIGVYGFQGDVVADQVAQIAADKLHLVSILACLHEVRYDIGASDRGFFRNYDTRGKTSPETIAVPERGLYIRILRTATCVPHPAIHWYA